MYPCMVHTDADDCLESDYWPPWSYTGVLLTEENSCPPVVQYSGDKNWWGQHIYQLVPVILPDYVKLRQMQVQS